MLIGISGEAGAGKDTFANILLSKLDELMAVELELQRYAFADPLKYIVLEGFGWNEEHAEALKDEPCVTNISANAFIAACTKVGLTQATKVHASVVLNLLKTRLKHQGYDDVIPPRKVFQTFGTDICRYHFGENVWVDLAPKENAIITDVRYENEAEFIRKQGFLIKIEGRNRNMAANSAGHSSETSVSAIKGHVTVVNDGSLLELEAKAQEVAILIMERTMLGDTGLNALAKLAENGHYFLTHCKVEEVPIHNIKLDIDNKTLSCSEYEPDYGIRNANGALVKLNEMTERYLSRYN